MSEQQSTELALPVITEDKYPALYVSGGLDSYYQSIREQKLEQERKDALLRQQQAVEQAAERERQRQIEEQNKIKYEAEQVRIQEEIKAADVEHRKEVNNGILSDLIIGAKAKGIDLSVDTAKVIVQIIATGKIRHTTIKY